MVTLSPEESWAAISRCVRLMDEGGAIWFICAMNSEVITLRKQDGFEAEFFRGQSVRITSAGICRVGDVGYFTLLVNPYAPAE